MVFAADIPPPLVDDLDGYPPEPKYEEDRTREYGSDEAFQNPYGWHGLGIP